ncbi:hypothetical protein SLS62_005673 [Diatrype stigma]|uniref:Uncharacterized protein n=1 Tax=Diatrype stigma TaxID=117547 RepID=A0AAN9USJ1_9PEZI
MAALGDDALYETTTERIHEGAFKIVLWIGIGSMAILISVAAVLQRFLGDIYLMMHVENGQAIPGPDFPVRMAAGLRADGVVLILDTVGIWLIKLNFLVFFYRLGHQIKAYLIAWWISLVVVISCLAVLLGVIPYSCSFGTLEHIVVECASESSVKYIYTAYRVSISIDVLSDAITWKTKINLRQKLILTSVFLLIVFNIAFTIVRGSIFGDLYGTEQNADHKENKMAQFDGAQRDHALAESPIPRDNFWWQRLQKSLLDTMATLEGTTLDRKTGKKE